MQLCWIKENGNGVDLLFFFGIEIGFVVFENVRLIGADNVDFAGFKPLHIISGDVYIIATIPPAGPLSKLSLARKPFTSERLPVLVMTFRLPSPREFFILLKY